MRDDRRPIAPPVRTKARSRLSQLVREADEALEAQAKLVKAGGAPVDKGPRWGWILAIVLLLLLAAASLGIRSMETGDGRRSQRAVLIDLQREVVRVAEAVESWRSARRGLIPDSLGQAGIASPTVRLNRLDDSTYELLGRDAGQAVAWRSGDPLDPLRTPP